MKRFCLFLALLFNAYLVFSQSEPAIIPKPKSLLMAKGTFKITSKTQIYVSKNAPEALNTAETLKQKFAGVSLLNLEISNVKPATNFIAFEKLETLKPEAYNLNISSKGIFIQASKQAGFDYAYQTLLQIFSPEIYSSSSQANLKLEIPNLSIKDEPRFEYRAMLLDVGRYYFPVYFIKKVIDQLALHKMNTLHWHLTEDQGWRIEIKKYPKLTEIGSVRKESPLGHNKEQLSDNTPHSGFYTQTEIREIVAYAARKNVEIIPEIEMPGHSLAAMAAYPELGCSGGPYSVKTRWGIEPQVLCPTPYTFTFLENVLTEVIDLFPSKYIHIGGDECPKESWKASAFCQNLIKEEGLKDENGLQSYFIKRIDKFLSSKGKKLIGWDEILEGGISPNATIMSWRGMEGGIEAARQNHDVIIATSNNLYLDNAQAKFVLEPVPINGSRTIDLEKVYSLEPIPTELTEPQKKYIKGVEALIWTEYISTPEHAEYMMHPRLAAAAEIAWSEPRKDFENFRNRLNTQIYRYQHLGINYSKALYDVNFRVDPTNRKIYMTNTLKDSKIRYTIDGTEPTSNSNLFNATSPPVLDYGLNINARTFNSKNEAVGRPIALPFVFSKSFQRKYTLANKPEKYEDKNLDKLTDGIKGYKLDNRDWVGFKDTDTEVTIDLGSLSQISRFEISFLSESKQGIQIPEEIKLEGSKDGKEFKELKAIKLGSSTQNSLFVQHLNASFDSSAARFVKLKVKNRQNNMIMIDEISIH
jgi:hexosaminidase